MPETAPLRPLRLGLDIGGTHSDGVLCRGTQVLAAVKTPTRHDDLLSSIRALLQALLSGQEASQVACVNLGTTLTTNALVTGRIAPVGVLVSAGPGIAPEEYRIGPQFHTVRGSINHVGEETAALDAEELAAALSACQDAGLRHYAVAGKFSPRNPAHEEAMAVAISQTVPEAQVFCGHRLSGSLNFGRRINTCFFNAGVCDLTRDFAQALRASLADFGLADAEVNILKADGGTMPLTRALVEPVQSILSGPAASIMGVLSALAPADDAVLLDIGGTTTDIALLAAGQPLLEREGIALAGRPTLVRALQTRSIALGGDTLLSVDAKGQLRCGPERLGPCLAAGGPAPTLMDACNVLGLSRYDDLAASQAGLDRLAAQAGTEPGKLAQQALSWAGQTLRTALATLLAEINAKPLYTIHEMLEERPLAPQEAIVLGGPAPVLQGLVQEWTGLATRCPPMPGVCNALGAALSRSTGELALHADSSRCLLLAASRGVKRRIGRDFTLKDAVCEAKRLLLEDMAASGVRVTEEEIQITQADAFNMVTGAYLVGKNIRVTAQVKPGVLGRVQILEGLASLVVE